MKIVGIIAEYNPFHNGHAYQIKRAKELSGADYCIAIMSGDFTQRGTPAIIDKYARTEMALSSGADLVLELPVCFATGSAEYFAHGAVSILDALHIDALCFGSECGEISVLKQIAAVLAEEPSRFKQFLQENIKKGMSFPAARSKAVSDYLAFPDAVTDISTESPDTDAVTAVLESPNNILGIEYIKALYRKKSTMEIYTVKRQGAGYAEGTLSAHTFSSALAIRNHLNQRNDLVALADTMPPESFRILKNYLSHTPAVVMDDFSSMLYYKLLAEKDDTLVKYLDVTESLSDKIFNSLFDFTDISVFCEQCLKTKDITLTRLCRSLFHILLNIKKADMEAIQSDDTALYAHILGFRKSAEALFGMLGNAEIPLISKLADADTYLPPIAQKMLQQDIFAAHLYEGVVAGKRAKAENLSAKNGGSIKNEYRRQLVILP